MQQTVTPVYRFLRESNELFPWIMKFDFNQFMELARQSAVSLLFSTRSLSAVALSEEAENERLKGNREDEFSDIAELFLEHYPKWGPRGLINALQSQASLVYSVVSEYINNEFFPAFEKEDAILFTRALTEYQAFKEIICDEERRAKGENWGSATGFFKAKWDELNEKVMQKRFPKEQVA